MELMLDYDRLSGVAPHPDGERLAYLSDASGRPQPWLWTLDGSGEPCHLPVDGTVTRCLWRPDGSRLLVQVDSDGAENYRLAEVDPATGLIDWLTEETGARHELGIPYGSIGNPYSPDGRLLAYASDARDRSCFDVLVRDLGTGEVRTVLRAGDPLAEDRYFPMFFSPGSRRLLVLRLHQNTEQDLFAIDLADLSVEHVTPHEGPAQYLPAGWTPEGIYLSTTQGRDYLGLALLTPGGDVRWLDTPDHDIDCASVSGDGKRLAWSVNTHGFTALHWRDLSDGSRHEVHGLPRGVAAQEFGSDGQSLTWAGNGRLVVLLGRPTAATDIWVAYLGDGCARQLTRCGQLLPDGLAEPEVIHYPSADGLIVSGLLYRPPGAGPVPVVLDIHGGPEFQALPLFSPLIQSLVERGIAVLAPDIRGSTGHGQHYQRLIYRDWGGGDLRDLAAAADYLRGQDWADGERLGVYGASYGGFAALSCLARLPDLWRAGVSVCGPSDLVTSAVMVPPTWRRRVRDWIGDPDDSHDARMLAERSPLTHVDRIRAPLLLAHGINDTRVAIAESERIHERLAERGHRCRLIRFEGEGHSVEDRGSAIALNQVIVDWFAEHLGVTNIRTDDSYQLLDARVMKLFGDQKYAEAFDLLTAEGPRYPENEIDVRYMRSCLAARQGDHDLAVEILDQALKAGLWFGETLLRRSPSWQPLQGRPDFENVVAACLARQRAELEGRPPAHYSALIPEGGTPPNRAIVALHGNGENVRKALDGWRTVLDEGWLLAAIESSQIVQSDGYVWDDTDVALREIREQYAALASDHELSADQLVIAGFSMGGYTALRIALSQAIPARGFILLGPGGPDPDLPDDHDGWLPLIEELRGRGIPLRGYLLAGQEDDLTPVEVQRGLADFLTEHGIPCGFEIVPGLAHAYPLDFRPIIGRALAFIGAQGARAATG
ncbi:MAG TPA: alpha/beta fold hydrolase [Streptosporangiaceae bacterium]|nr:alpha/beta fold hydrolase [Streptosporangiaceae bacterium]